MRQFEILKLTRQYLLNDIKDLTTDQLNEIPAGFNNNIIWNLAHMLATQQGICYARAGIKLVIDQSLFDAYKPGTKPEKFVDANEVAETKKLFIAMVDRLEIDYANNVFTNFTAFTNRYGFEHRHVDDSINFVLYHEGIHFGVINAMMKLVKK
ncbi:MAG TPA: DinB family protein [Ferruginibacter sp.]|nr:DinB family protein [Ferruginibacter sp.]